MAKKTTTVTRPKQRQRISAKAQRFREQAAAAVKDLERSYIDLAEALFEIKHGNMWKDWGIASFAEYCSIELDTQPGKANALTQIWDKIMSLGLPKSRIAELGWSKARILSRHITAKNADDLLDSAENQSVREFEEHCRKLYPEKSKPRASMLRIEFQPDSAQATVMTQVLNVAKEMYDTDDPSIACAAMAADWLASKGPVPEKLPIDGFIQLLERIYGGKIEFTEHNSVEEALSDEGIELGAEFGEEFITEEQASKLRAMRL